MLKREMVDERRLSLFVFVAEEARAAITEVASVVQVLYVVNACLLLALFCAVSQ